MSPLPSASFVFQPECPSWSNRRTETTVVKKTSGCEMSFPRSGRRQRCLLAFPLLCRVDNRMAVNYVDTERRIASHRRHINFLSYF